MEIGLKNVDGGTLKLSGIIFITGVVVGGL